MTKENARKFLSNCGYEIAEVVCNLVNINGDVKTDCNILVLLVDEPMNLDLIEPNNHWWICESIDELLGENYPMNLHKVDFIKEIKEFEPYF